MSLCICRDMAFSQRADSHVNRVALHSTDAQGILQNSHIMSKRTSSHLKRTYLVILVGVVCWSVLVHTKQTFHVCYMQLDAGKLCILCIDICYLGKLLLFLVLIFEIRYRTMFSCLFCNPRWWSEHASEQQWTNPWRSTNMQSSPAGIRLRMKHTKWLFHVYFV